ncbi:MAG: hypothetical protein QOD07_2422 [Frankiaceae bacterium]|nr:hypothetical protein [Frankiaceae bacterium]
MPAPPLDTSQQRGYAAAARREDARDPSCDLTGPVLAAVMYVDHATHAARARATLPTALALCAAGTHLDRTDALTLALYRYAHSGAYARAVLAVADEYGAA